VNLPRGANREIDPSASSLIVTVTATGEILVQGTVVKADDLQKLFAAAHAKDPLTQVIIQAEEGVPHGIIVRIMEQAKQVGLTRLAISTKGSGAKP
jgi:biopolymer transport protein TolR